MSLNMSQNTPVSLLEELCNQQDLTTSYKLISVSGPSHAPTFLYCVLVEEINEKQDGTGTSTKKAKHAAAKCMLEKLLASDGRFPGGFQYGEVMITMANLNDLVGSYGSTTNEQAISAQAVTQDNPMSKLQELCVKNKWPLPAYEMASESGPPHDKTFVMTCQVFYSNCEEIIEEGVGKCKRSGKREASVKVWNIIREKMSNQSYNAKSEKAEMSAESVPSNNCSGEEVEPNTTENNCDTKEITAQAEELTLQDAVTLLSSDAKSEEAEICAESVPSNNCSAKEVDPNTTENNCDTKEITVQAEEPTLQDAVTLLVNSKIM